MRNPGLIFFPALLLGSFAASAQNITEAYNLSNLTVQGTARSMGFGNALGSVGGDFSSLSVNPAGLGVYRTSEILFTPSLRMNSTSSEYTGVTTNDNNTHYNTNNFGLVLTNAPRGRNYDRRNWKALSFAFGMNRTADFNHDYTYTGKNTTSSASQLFASDANLNPNGVTTNGSNSLGYMGYNSYLINLNAANGQYYSIVPYTGGVTQLKSTQQNGGVNEYTISMGGNYKEKLMLGLTIGIPVLNYWSSTVYSETLADGNNMPNDNGFHSFTYGQTLNVTGGGVNAKIGAIYKINDFFRVGAAFHSPTYYSISEASTPVLTAVHNDSTVITNSDSYGNSLTNRFDYNLTTPWKGVLSATVLLEKFGFITADYEYVDYSTMQYRYSQADYFGNAFQAAQDAMNASIKKTYKPASNFRLGLEAKLSNFFMLRFGFGYYGNAYTSYGESVASTYYTTQRIDLSTGLGFHFRHFFTDLGFVHSMYQGFEQPYSIDYSGLPGTPVQTVPTAKVDFNINNLAWTLGFKF